MSYIGTPLNRFWGAAGAEIYRLLVIFVIIKQCFHNTNTLLLNVTPVCRLCEPGCCQSYFRETSIPVSSSEPLFWAVLIQPMDAVVPKFTELHQQAASAGLGAREWSVSPWHGMPTALGKSKRFLN